MDEIQTAESGINFWLLTASFASSWLIRHTSCLSFTRFNSLLGHNQFLTNQVSGLEENSIVFEGQTCEPSGGFGGMKNPKRL